MADVTQILCRIEEGDPAAAEQLLPLLYDELRELAAAKLKHEKPGQTLQATALVHEAYLRLVNVRREQHWDSRRHFYAAAAEAMRRILIENARRKQRIRHGGQLQRLDIEPADLPCTIPDDDLLALDEALRRLDQEDPIKARLVNLRVFAGLTIEQAADTLGISTASANRYWRYSKAWLHSVLRPDAGADN